MSEPMTSEPPPFEITLRNDAGHGVLNIPDAPQSMVLAITNRSATVMQTRALGKVDDPADRFHFELRFRPHTLRSIGHIELAPESTGSWRVECRVDHDHTQVVSIRSVRRRRWNAGETEIIRLQRISAEPRGGTRLTRVEVATQNLAALGSTDLVAAHHTLNMRVARSKVGAFDDARRLRSGSGATIGPITAGFVDGAGLVADGESLSRLRLRLVNTSHHPVHLSGDDDAASRVDLEFGTASSTAPWGLLRGHGDHLTATLYEPGETEAAQVEAANWSVDGQRIRCRRDHTWGPGAWLEIVLDVHSSAVPGDTQLVARLVDFPDFDDAELVLLVHVAPLAAFPDAIVAVRPVQLWGERGRVDFHGSGYLADRSDDPDGRVAIADDGPLELSARGGVRVNTSLRVIGPFADGGNEHGGALHVGRSTGANLRLGWHRDYSWIQSHGPSELRINPAGNSVSIGSQVQPDSAVPLTVRDRVEIHGPKASDTESRSERDLRAHLALGRSADHAWIRSGAGALRLNPTGDEVTIGPVDTTTSWRGYGLTVGNALRVVGKRDDGTLLSLVMSTSAPTPRVTDALGLGAGQGFSFVDSGPDRWLTLNMNNRPVVVNHTPPAQGAALTVGGAAHVTGELSVNDTLRIGQWEIRDEYDRNGGQRVLRVYFDGQRTDTISAG